MRLFNLMSHLFRPVTVTVTALVAYSLIASTVFAGPEGGVITSGSGSIQQPDINTTLVTQDSATLSINWQSLNLASDERLQFLQPSQQAVSLNHILDQSPSQIYGRIDANGQVYLMNPNGFIFGESARINTAAFMAGAFTMDTQAYLRGEEFDVELGPGGIDNAGQISVSEGGSVSLVGSHMANSGSIEARLGRIQLLSADSATLSFDADGMIRFAVAAPASDNTSGNDNAIYNTGKLQADGGYVVLQAAAENNVYASVINNEGVIQATRISNEGGVVRLEGSGGNVLHSGSINVSGMDGASGGNVTLLGDRVGVLGDASINASGHSGGGDIHIGGLRKGAGEHNAQFTQVSSQARISSDAQEVGDGGEIVIWADDTTWAYGDVSARGGRVSGNGGFVEISGKQGLVLQGSVDVTAPNGATGTLLLDPTDIVIHDQADGVQANDGDLPDLSNGTVGVGTFDIGELALEGLAGTSNLVLEATNNITLNNLADNVLAFNINNGGSIIIAADTDADGAGSFSMDSGDTISTQGGSIDITAAGISAGAIDTDGPAASDGNITLSSSTSIALGAATAGSQAISIIIDNDANGTETLTLGGSLSGGSVSLQGGANGGDTLIGPNINNSWAINALNTGTINGANFSNFPSLQGGSADDTFAFSGIGSLSGDIDGGAHTVGDTVNYVAATGIIAVTLDSDVINIENLIGGGADYTLIANDIPNSWTITGSNDGTIAGVSFTDFSNLFGGNDIDDFVLAGGSVTGTINGGAGVDSLTANNTANTWNILSADTGNVDSVFAFTSIENLTGGNGSDSFTLNGGSVSGAIDGGAGSDSLAADDVANTWNITGANSGDVTGIGSFVAIENLNGRNNTDDFNFSDGAVISGAINGNNGFDTVDQSSQSAAVVVDLGGGGYSNIEQYTGNGTNSTLIGDDIPNVWTLTGSYDGVDDGTLGGITFIDFNNITGGADDDSFALSGGTLSGTIDGGAGTDTLTADNINNTWNITGVDAGDVDGIAAFANMENLSGNGGDDAFVFADGSSLSGVVDGAAGNDSVDFSAETAAVSVTIGSSGFTNIESFVGNNTNSTLIGDNIANTWVFTGINDGDINGTLFTDFNNVIGGANVDSFSLSGGSLTGNVDGGIGNDSVVADNASNTWNITAADAGNVTGINSFANIENLVGNAGDDTFQFADPGLISGTVNGAAGTDTVDFSAKTGAVVVDLDASNYLGVENYIGNIINSTLQGSNTTSTWTISSANSGTVNTVNFSGFNNLSGSDSDDTFILAGGTITGNVNGGAGTDTLQGSNAGDTWNITGADVGNTSGIGGFADIEILAGGDGADTFNFSNGSSFSGTINGGNGIDTIDLSAEAATVSIDLAGSGYLNIESFVGNGTDSTLIGENLANTWNITGVDSGDVNGFNFAGFNNLLGNALQDQFVLNGGSISGVIDGGADSDTLIADNTVNAWSITGIDTGNVSGVNSFTAIENISGGSDVDVFTFANASSISGNVDGGAGVDSADLSAVSGAVSISLGVGGFSNIESFTGNNTNSTLIGPAQSNVWTITGTNDGTVGTVSFTNFNNLTGNSNSDDFVFQDGSAISGVIDGGLGLDSVDLSAQSGVVTVDLSSSNYLNIETFVGNNSNSTLTGDSVANTWNITASNDGSIGSVSFYDFNNLIGNSDIDTFTLNGGTITGSINGGAGSDSLQADNIANNWTITAADSGNISGTLDFASIENLYGNSDTDDFVFNDGGGISGTVEGGIGVDSVDQSAQSGFVNILLGGSGYNNIENFIGNGTNSTLTGDNTNNSWVISGADSGTVGTVAYNNFSNLQGGSADDSFILSGGSISGQVAGGGGIDQILAANTSNTWNITGADSGDVSGINAFSGVEILLGNAAQDDYIFANGSSFSGTIDGAAGSDVVDVSSELGATLISLDSGQYQNIELFIGNNTDSTLLGENIVNTWTISASNAGDINGVSFTGFNHLLGNASADNFVLQSGNITGSIDGATGNDSIYADNISNTWNITAANTGDVNNVAAFQNIDNLIGNASIDSFNIAADLAGNIVGGSGDDTVNLAGTVNIGGSIMGGQGSDTINGPDLANSWNVTGTDSGTINGIIFSEFENLNGGSDVDTFSVSNAATTSLTGVIDSGAGDDALNIDYSAASTRSIDFIGGSGVDTITLTGSASGLDNSYVFGPALNQVSITTTAPLASQTINANEVESVADSLSANSIAFSGSGGDDAITLAPGSIGGTQPINFQMAGWMPVAFSNKTHLAIDAGLGTDSITVTGAVALSGGMSFAAESINQGAAGQLGADTLSFNQATTIGTAATPLATSVNTLQINGPTGDVYVDEADGLALSASNVTGNLDITTQAGDITSSGSIVVTGSSAFTVGAGGSIILDDTGNQFAGTPTFASTGTIYDLVLHDNSAVDIQGLNIGHDLSIYAGGALSQSGSLQVANDSYFDAGSNPITLNDGANDFIGTVSLQNSGANDVTISDQNALIFDASNLGSGNFTVNAGSLAQSGPIVQEANANTTTFSVTNGSLILDHAMNDFTGIVQLNNTSANDTVITESDFLQLGSSTTNGGNLIVNTSNGVTLSGTTNSNNGDITVTATTGDISLGRLDAGTGKITLHATSGSVIGNNSPITDPNLSAQNLEIVTGAAIGDYNNPIAINIPDDGTSFFDAGTGSANIIGNPGTIVSGSILVNNVAITSLAVGKGQSVAYLKTIERAAGTYYGLPLFSIVDGGVQLPRRLLDEDDSKRRPHLP